jgi:acyl phosphate:glycerol-3-phosphate acyltransferase
MTGGVVLATAYLLGSIPFAWLIARRWRHVDLRGIGSGNVGAANVMRTGSARLAAVVAALDALKGAAAVLIARRTAAAEDISVLAGVAAVAGRCFPLWLGFRGGKGVATAAGVFACLAPRALVVAVAVFVAALWRTRYASVASIAATVTLMVMAVAFGLPARVQIAAFVAGTIVLARHRGNIQRLIAGRELRLERRTPPVNR